MKKIILALLAVFFCFNAVFSQITKQQKTVVNQEVKPVNNMIIKRDNLATKAITKSAGKPGSFMENTPVVVAPAGTNGNSVSFSFNSVTSTINDEAGTKYYFFDSYKNGKDNLLAINPTTTRNGLRRLGKNASNNISQVGEFSFPAAINLTDDIYFGEFSPENGSTVLVNDKRSNQFWHYQHNSTNYMVLERPYSMLSNWVIAGKYLTE
jgi:hypothetical protein